MRPPLTLTPDDVRLLARVAGLDLEPERAEVLTASVNALLVGDAHLIEANLHVMSAAGPVWPEVTGG